MTEDKKQCCPNTPDSNYGHDLSVNCCSSPTSVKTEQWMTGLTDTPIGPIPVVRTHISKADKYGEILVRLNIKRMDYTVMPGLYAAGTPDSDSPVFVSANYKLSFDKLRRELSGINAWILTIDTKGINVWCAAGKGTFGTDELVSRIGSTKLSDVVTHRKIIVPQLGAPGVAAHEVKKLTGFRVIYGPVRAEDIPEFIESKMQATPEMRRVNFPLIDRLALIPVELTLTVKYALIAIAIFAGIAGLTKGGYDIGVAWTRGTQATLLLLLAVIGGGSLTPALLPWIPGRAFALKGAVVGLLLSVLAVIIGLMPTSGLAITKETAAWALIIISISAFMGMNFTGASTLTSLSGVKKEMRYAVPFEIISLLAGFILWIMARPVQP